MSRAVNAVHTRVVQWKTRFQGLGTTWKSTGVWSRSCEFDDRLLRPGNNTIETSGQRPPASVLAAAVTARLRPLSRTLEQPAAQRCSCGALGGARPLLRVPERRASMSTAAVTMERAEAPRARAVRPDPLRDYLAGLLNNPNKRCIGIDNFSTAAKKDARGRPADPRLGSGNGVVGALPAALRRGRAVAAAGCSALLRRPGGARRAISIGPLGNCSPQPTGCG